MNLDGIDVFVQVVRAGSFSEAARRLGMPKSTVSLRVAELERRLGVSLLQRTTRRVRPTEAGAAYFSTASRVLSELRAAEDDLGHAQQEPRGTLRVSSTILAGVGVVGDLLTRFVSQYPHIEIDLQLSERRADLLAENIDVAFRFGVLENASGLVAKRLGTSYRKLYASPDYLRRHGTPSHPRELREHAFLCFSAGSELHLVDERGARCRVRVAGRFRSNQLMALRHQALGGLGIVSLPTGVAAEEVRRGTLVPVLPTWRSDAVPVHLVYLKQRFATAKVRALVGFAAQEYAALASGERVSQARPRPRTKR